MMNLISNSEMKCCSPSLGSKQHSLVNLFKFVVIVAFIKYELINQQQVVGRQRGLIYNKDGKFIYRPPKSNQGHIIVIDDRHRESNSKAVSDSSSVQENNSETAYQPIQLISPRIYHHHPQQQQQQHAVTSTAVHPLRTVYPGAQIQLINLNELQPIGRLQAADPRAVSQILVHQNPGATALQSTGATGAASSPIPIMPIVQLYHQPAAASQRLAMQTSYGLAPMQSTQQATTMSDYAIEAPPAEQQFQHITADSQQVAQSNGPYRFQRRPRMFEAPPDAYEHQLNGGYESGQSGPPQGAFLEDSPLSPPSRGMYVQNHHQAGGSESVKQRSDSPQMQEPIEQLGEPIVDMYEEQMGMRMNSMPNSRIQGPPDLARSPKSFEGPIVGLIPIQPVMPNSNGGQPPQPQFKVQESARSKPSFNGSEQSGGKGGVKYLKRSTYTKLRDNLEAGARRLTSSDSNNQPDEQSSEINSNNIEAKGGNYWKQFKDQFEII